MFRSLLVCVFALSGASVGAQCASDDEIVRFVDDYVQKQPAKALNAGGSMDDALCTQAKLATALEPHMGPVVGYKAGLTSKPAQDRFKVSEPVQGVLYRDMMLENGAELPAGWGTRPVFESDLILVVGDAAINQATTVTEAMAHISTVHPFMELPDLTLAKGEPITGVTLTAMGVGPRLGVLGAGIPVTNPAEMEQALADMQVTLRAANGEVLVEVPGKAVMGHPVNSVLWLMSKGIELKSGDMVSVGSFGPLFPPVKGKGGASVTYTGLPGNPSVSVVFQ
jgi:2-keto-4-pentenoate hydratase